jgi:UDP-N-acetylglucosamine--N-acetylmuramyl-(pentapeptide) pyrophosphoryl-undecaprenol N-acetylglucosamine transferase
VFSVGGYAAGPVSAAAASLGVPVALLEPNSAIGLANRLMAPFVRRAYTAFAMAERHFAPSAVLRTGVPLRAGFAPRAYRVGKPRTILVLGGSQGAKSLNEVVPEALARVRTPLRVVHQCGSRHQSDVEGRYADLGLAHAYRVVPFIDDMPRALAEADLVVGRSGASCVSEICAIGRPSLLIPYPFASSDHQWHNARALELRGAALSVRADEVSVERLAADIERLVESPDSLIEMAKRAGELGRPEAARSIASDLLRLARRLPEADREPRAPAARRSEPGPLTLRGVVEVPDV